MANIAPGDQPDKARVRELLDKLRAEYPGLWESLSEDQRERISRAAISIAASGGGYWKFRAQVWTFPSFTNWSAANPGVGTPAGGGDPSEEELPPEEDGMIEEPPLEAGETTLSDEGDDIRGILLQFLRENDLPESLMTFINDALAQGMSSTEIIARLRETPEYLAAYPENGLRRQNGLSWIPESQIRAMRDEINRITEATFGIRLDRTEVQTIIGKGRSLAEWESNLRDYATFLRWGPTVQAVLQWELGYSIPDERAFALISQDIPTPELTRAYERALMRGQPAILGLGVRPDEEAELLRRYGISPEQAFKGYQGIVGELPAAERFAAIEAAINAQLPNQPSTTDLFADTPFATLFRAIQLGDAEAIRTLQDQMAREFARFQAGGQPARSSSGALAGLLPEEQRAGV